MARIGAEKVKKKKTYKVWTKSEEEYLMDSWGSTGKKTIARVLGRSVAAINQKAHKMGLGPFLESGDYITINQLLIELVGIDTGRQYTLDQWIDKGLPIRKQIVDKESYRVVKINEFWKWAEKNKTIIDFSRLEYLAFGKEPEWVSTQRRIDKENNYFKSTPWTEGEDATLKMMLGEYKYTYRDLSLSLRRTEGAIKRRLVDLGIKARPVRMSNHNPWTKEETELLIKLYKKGHNRNTYPNYINRSAQACGGKIERLIKDGVIKPRNKYRKSC